MLDPGRKIDGHRRWWRELAVRRADWPACESVSRWSTRREGRWRASRSQLAVQESWRVEDGDWFVDVQLGDHVQYGDAERIVLAIRRETLVNRLPISNGPLTLNTAMPDLDANQVCSVVAGSEPGHFDVRVSAGQVLTVAVVGEAVELRHIGSALVRADEPPDHRLRPSAGWTMTRRG